MVDKKGCKEISNHEIEYKNLATVSRFKTSNFLLIRVHLPPNLSNWATIKIKIQPEKSKKDQNKAK